MPLPFSAINSPGNSESQRRGILLIVFFTIFVDLLGFAMFIPLLANVARDLNATATQAALLASAYSLGTFSAVGVLGRLSDRYGRRPILVGTIVLSLLCQLLTGFSHTYIMLLLARYLAGCAAGNIAVAQAIIGDITPPAERGRSMVVVGLAFGGGFAVGPAMGAVIASFLPGKELVGVGLLAAFFNLLNLIFIVRRVPETTTRAPASSPASTQSAGLWHDLRWMFQSPQLRVLCLLQFLQIFGFVGVETILPMALRDSFTMNHKDIFSIFVFIGVCVLVIQGGFTRRVIKKWGEAKALLAGQFFLGLGICGIPLSVWGGVPALFAALFLVCCGTSLANPALSGLASRAAPLHLQGTVLGAVQTTGSLARIVGPLFMGTAYGSLGGIGSLYVSAAVILFGGIMGLKNPLAKE